MSGTHREATDRDGGDASGGAISTVNPSGDKTEQELRRWPR